MKVDGKHLISVAPGLVYPLLLDANALRRIIPGCEALSLIGPNEYSLKVRQRLGPYDDLFTGTLHLSEKEPASCLRAVANLESPNGMVRVVGDVVLEEAGDDNTLLRYEADLELGGRLAAVSPRLQETTANAFERRMMEALERETAGAQPFVMRRAATAMDPATTQDHQFSLALPSWVGPALLALGGIVILRLLDNRRIDRLTKGYTANDITSRTNRS